LDVPAYQSTTDKEEYLTQTHYTDLRPANHIPFLKCYIVSVKWGEVIVDPWPSVIRTIKHTVVSLGLTANPSALSTYDATFFWRIYDEKPQRIYLSLANICFNDIPYASDIQVCI